MFRGGWIEPPSTDKQSAKTHQHTTSLLTRNLEPNQYRRDDAFPSGELETHRFADLRRSTPDFSCGSCKRGIFLSGVNLNGPLGVDGHSGKAPETFISLKSNPRGIVHERKVSLTANGVDPKRRITMRQANLQTEQPRAERDGWYRTSSIHLRESESSHISVDVVQKLWATAWLYTN